MAINLAKALTGLARCLPVFVPLPKNGKQKLTISQLLPRNITDHNLCVPQIYAWLAAVLPSAACAAARRAIGTRKGEQDT